jgi:hypothetical protein
MSAADDLRKAQEALNDPKFKGPYLFEKKQYSLTGLRDELIPVLEGRKAAEEKQAQETVRGFAAFNANVRRLEKQVKELQDIVNRDRNAFAKGKVSEAELSKSEKKLADAQLRLESLTTREAAPTGRTAVTTTQPTTTTAQPTGTATVGATTTTTPATSGTSTGAAGGGKKGGKKASDTAITTSWEETFKQKFPQYAYLLDVNVFGQDMSDLLRRAVTEKWYDSDQLETLMSQGVSGTNYYRNTTTNQQAFDKLTPANRQQLIDQKMIALRDTFGNLQFSEKQLMEIATKASRDGKEGKALELFVYQQALATTPGATGFVAATPASRVLSSAEADRIRAIGRDYGVRLSDQEVQDVLTGRKSEDDLRQSYKLVARKLYKGAEEDIDAGLTIQQIFAPYRQYAAAILEKSPNQIDFIDQNGVPTVYADALQGQEGPLSLGQWVQKLKSDPKYGYQYTSQANAEVSGMVSTLEKAFGFRK